MNTNFQVIGLTRLGIKPKSTAPEADAHTTRSSELKRHVEVQIYRPFLLAVEQNFALLVILHISRVKSENFGRGGAGPVSQPMIEEIHFCFRLGSNL